MFRAESSTLQHFKSSDRAISEGVYHTEGLTGTGVHLAGCCPFFLHLCCLHLYYKCDIIYITANKIIESPGLVYVFPHIFPYIRTEAR